MTIETLEQQTASLDPTAPLIVFSADAHMGPRLEDMRQYCPKEFLDDYDAFAGLTAAAQEAMRSAGGFFAGDPDEPRVKQLATAMERNAQTDGHHDVHAYLHDMDNDGVAAEVFFHGSQNNQPVPMVSPIGFSFDHTSGEDLKQRAAGLHIYNQWLADAVAVAPDRLFPATLLPMWDIDASIAELEWCRERGLRVVSFSAPRPGIASYDDPSWEPFWSACEDAGAVLATHSGAIDLQGLIDGAAGPHAFCLVELEAGGWLARRALARLIFSGVFERHPHLRFLLSEQNGEWWSATAREYDSSYVNHRHMIKDQVPETPSYYLKQNVFIGASFMAPFEAEWAAEQGYWTNVFWGRDYPHIEGTFVYQDEDDAKSEANLTHQSWRNTFASIAPEKTAAMLGDNAVRALDLDAAALGKIASGIHAPTLEELAKPIDHAPGDGGVLAFRTIGAWW